MSFKKICAYCFLGDYKEGYYVGVEVHEDDPQAEKPFYGPNLWPSAGKLLVCFIFYLDGGKPWSDIIRRHCKRVAKAIARIIALALDLDAGFFDKPAMLGEAIATLRLLHYEGANQFTVDILFSTVMQICKDRDAKPQVWEYVAPVKGLVFINCLLICKDRDAIPKG
ncbi:hypothetical protein BHM03_00054225 [Ensete ventricosum]|nr:hypothetical protein BHM03_00054225 [Ensete ventricosum]